MMRWLAVIGMMLATARGADTPQTAEEIIKFATAKSAGYRTWSAELRQSVNLMGVPMTLEGQTWFKAPRLTRTEMQMPLVGAMGKMTMIWGADGILWQEMDLLGQKKVMKMDMNLLASNLTARGDSSLEGFHNPDPARQWEASKKFMEYSVVPGAAIDGQAVWVLEGRWKPSASSNPALAQQVATIGKMRLYIGQHDGFTHRIEQFDKTGAKTVVRTDFTKIKFNEPLDDGMFQYRPPAGIEAIDITEMSLQMIQQGAATAPGKP